jgi:hypothetical protein
VRNVLLPHYPRRDTERAGVNPVDHAPAPAVLRAYDPDRRFRFAHLPGEAS